MALTKTGRLFYGSIFLIAILVGIGVWQWPSVSAMFKVAGKKVGEVKELEPSSYEADEALNVEVVSNVDYDLPFHPLPSEESIGKKSLLLNGVGIMWNASSPLCGANGGKSTKKGSYIDELGGKLKSDKKDFALKLGRQDDYSKQQDELVTFASEYKKSNGRVTSKGAAFVWYMGDNSEIYQTVTNNKLMQVDPELKSVGWVITGYSYGEDKFMGPVEWRDDPEQAKGAIISCYPQDGDQNLAIKWAADNGIPINPDGQTYCPNAINFAFTDGFMEAAEAWGTKTGKRLLVEITPDGKTIKTGGYAEPKEILGTATWTPGDELAFNKAKQAGIDLVSIYSTKDNAHQMPCLLVTTNKFYEDNPQVVDAITESVTRFADQMKAHPKAFEYAMGAMAEVYEQKTADYWGSFFNGVIKKTPNGHEVVLGGTRVCNMADNLDALGVGDNSRNTFKSSYELFGGFMHQLYPEVLPERLPYYEAINVSSIERVSEKMKKDKSLTKPMIAEFKSGEIAPEDKVAQRNYTIEFETGKASLTKTGLATMEGVFNDLNTHDLRIRIIGHTDNQGTDAVNNPLSDARAQTVQNWLQSKNQASFPNNRFEEVSGKGSQEPIADNGTAAGRARNRRVEITVGY